MYTVHWTEQVTVHWTVQQHFYYWFVHHIFLFRLKNDIFKTWEYIPRCTKYLGYFYMKIGCARCASILTRFFFHLIFILLCSEKNLPLSNLLKKLPWTLSSLREDSRGVIWHFFLKIWAKLKIFLRLSHL